MLSWISRGTLELVAQAALGGTLDPLEEDHPGEYGQAMKLLLYVYTSSVRSHMLTSVSCTAHPWRHWP